MSAMREVNSFSMGTASGTPASLQRPVAFEDGEECIRMRDEVTIPMKNAQAGAENLTVQDALDALTCLLGSCTNSFGDKAKDTFDDALSFDDLRAMWIEMTGRDFLINGKEINKQNLTDVIFSAVAAGATKNVVCEVARAFEYVKLGKYKNLYCPGASQMRTVSHLYKRSGNAFTSSGNFSQDGGATIVTMFDMEPEPTGHDRWAKVLRLYINDEGGRVSHGPGVPVALFAAWEKTAAGTSTALGNISLRCEGAADILSDVQASRVVRDADYLLPFGSLDLNTLVTQLHRLPATVDLNQVPTGVFKLEDPGQELNPMNTVWLYAEAVDEAHADAVIAPNVVSGTQPEVRLSGSALTRAPDAQPHIAATLPMNLLRPDEPMFETAPSRAYVKGKSPVTFIPAGVTATAQAQVAAAGKDDKSKAAAATHAAKTIAKGIPGATTPHKGKTTTVAQGVGAHVFGGLVAHAQSAFSAIKRIF